MATRLMSGRAKVVVYLPSLRAAVRHFRAFSSYDERYPSDHTFTVDSDSVLGADSQRQWPNSQLGPLNPRDRHFPLPGLVGTATPQQHQLAAPPVQHRDVDLLTAELPEERRISILHQYLHTAEELEQKELGEDLLGEPSPFDVLECVAQQCPALLKKDFQELFPDRDFNQDEVSVITISQKTNSDMIAWSIDMEDEREELMEHFVNASQEICNSLTEAGYWADFIDPTSGRPYLGAYTNATLYETDERYRSLGFTIEDLGCCKVIKHHLWGTHTYVGCLFTNAPMDHPIIQRMKQMRRFNDE